MTILKTLVLAVSILTAGFLYWPNVSLAGDVWRYSRDGRSLYLDSESVNAGNLPMGMDYRVSVKSVIDSDGSLEKVIIYGFESQNDILVGAIFDKSAGKWDFPEYSRERPVFKAILETMKPYMKQKRISFSDSWKWE